MSTGRGIRSLLRTAARLLGVVVLCSAPVIGTGIGTGAVASASTVRSTSAEIAALRGQIAAAAGRVRDLTTRYDEDEVVTADLAQQLVADRTALGTAAAQAAAGLRSLGQAALDAYTGATAGTVPGDDPLGPDIGATYLQLAAGDLTDTVDQYRLERRQLAVAERTVAADEASAVRAQAAAAATRAAALARAGASESKLDSLETQLVSLEQAQADAAASAGTAPAAVAQGGPVRHGLVAAVAQLVSPSGASATPGRATPPAAPSTPSSTAAPTSGDGPSTTGAPTTAAPTTPAPTTTTPPTTTPPTTAPPTGQGGGAAPTGGVWLELRECESGDDYQADTGNGFYGAYQFSAETWTDLGYPGRPDLEPPAMQDAAAERLQAEAGWGQWPACAAALGLT